MGRGGEKTLTPPPSKALEVDVQLATTGKHTQAQDERRSAATTSTSTKRFEELPTEVLRKKAAQFGHNANADRETLLKELVSVCLCILDGGVCEHVCPLHV